MRFEDRTAEDLVHWRGVARDGEMMRRTRLRRFDAALPQAITVVATAKTGAACGRRAN